MTIYRMKKTVLVMMTQYRPCWNNRTASLRGLIPTMTIQLQDRVAAEIQEVMLLIPTHQAVTQMKTSKLDQKEVVFLQWLVEAGHGDAIPGPGRVRADRSQSPTRQPASGRGRTMARGRVPVRDHSTSRDRGWCDNFTPRQNTVEFTANVGPTFRRNRLPANVFPIHVFELFFEGPVIDLFVEQVVK